MLFVCGPGGDARRYRCDHQREQLELAGLHAHVAYRDHLELASLADRFRTVVLFRVPYDDDVARLIARATERGASVLADVDDLVFEPAATHYLRALDVLEPAERRIHEEAIAGIRRTLEAVAGITVSTEPLASAAAAVNSRVAVVPNAVSAAMVRMGDAAGARVNRHRPPTLGYLSGTPTHDVDFREAAPAIEWALERFPDLRFLAVGYIELDERLDRFGTRVERIPAVPWQRLPDVLARVDVNLAPLEPGNPFTEGKSCIKYLEAALVGVPTIASPRADFRRAIAHGETGLLADDADGWREALAALVESSELRAQLGAAARRDVIRRHTTAARASAASEAFASLVDSLEMPSNAS